MSEFQLCIIKCKREVEIGNEVLELSVIESCDTDLCSNFLLQILATLPVSAALVEQLFSTIRSLMMWVSLNKKKERLTNIALLNIYKNIVIYVGNIIFRFRKQNKGN